MSSSRWRRPRLPAPEKPLRDELLSIERLEERALALAASLTIDPDPRRRARDTFPRFDDNVRLLRAAYRTLADDVRTGQFVVPAADWLLDNFHLITSEISDIRRNLPRTYSRTLPTLASREHAGHARVYAIAVELIRHSDSRLDRQQLIQFLNSYQRVAPLTIGELWAWPSMLKLALIENLRRLAEELLSARAARGAADRYVSRADDQEQRRSAAGRPRTGVHRPAAASRSRVRPAACRRFGSPWTTISRRDTRRPRRRFEASTSVRAWRRSRWRTRSRASASARRSTGRSTSRRSAWSNACCSAIRRARTAAWTS